MTPVRTIINRCPLTIERGEDPGEETSFAFSRGAVTALSTAQSGIEQVPEGISEHVEGVDDQREEKPRPERQPGGMFHEPAPFAAEHASPHPKRYLSNSH